MTFDILILIECELSQNWRFVQPFPIKKTYTKTYTKKTYELFLPSPKDVKSKHVLSVHNPYTTYIFFVKFLDSQKGAPKIIGSSASGSRSQRGAAQRAQRSW